MESPYILTVIMHRIAYKIAFKGMKTQLVIILHPKMYCISLTQFQNTII